jgi:hypothetical protein
MPFPIGLEAARPAKTRSLNPFITAASTILSTFCPFSSSSLSLYEARPARLLEMADDCGAVRTSDRSEGPGSTRVEAFCEIVEGEDLHELSHYGRASGVLLACTG